MYLILSLFLSVGCYQVDSLPSLDDGISGNLLVCAKSNVEGPFETFGTLSENFESFFTSYVKAPDGSVLPADLDYSTDPEYDSRFDYASLLEDKEKPEVKKLRNSILGHLNSLDLSSLTTDEQVATLLNAYNFIAVDIVIQNSCEGLINSIADLGGKDSFKAFSDTRNFGYFINGERLSLDTIEKERIAELTDFEDARIHFAVICASGGCPVLLHKPYTGAELDDQLSFITRAGLRLPRMFNNEDGTSFISQIFDWYLDDFISDVARTMEFENDEEYIQEFIKRYTPDGTVFNVDDFDFVDYDWTLNKL